MATLWLLTSHTHTHTYCTHTYTEVTQGDITSTCILHFPGGPVTLIFHSIVSINMRTKANKHMYLYKISTCNMTPKAAEWGGYRSESCCFQMGPCFDTFTGLHWIDPLMEQFNALKSGDFIMKDWGGCAFQLSWPVEVCYSFFNQSFDVSSLCVCVCIIAESSN